MDVEGSGTRGRRGNCAAIHTIGTCRCLRLAILATVVVYVGQLILYHVSSTSFFGPRGTALNSYYTVSADPRPPIPGKIFHFGPMVQLKCTLNSLKKIGFIISALFGSIGAAALQRRQLLHLLKIHIFQVLNKKRYRKRRTCI